MDFPTKGSGRSAHIARYPSIFPGRGLGVLSIRQQEICSSPLEELEYIEEPLILIQDYHFCLTSSIRQRRTYRMPGLLFSGISLGESGILQHLSLAERAFAWHVGGQTSSAFTSSFTVTTFWIRLTVLGITDRLGAFCGRAGRANHPGETISHQHSFRAHPSLHGRQGTEAHQGESSKGSGPQGETFRRGCRSH